MSGRYLEQPPRADLADQVQCVWLFEQDGGDGVQAIAPDGRCELIVHFGRPYQELGPDGFFEQAPCVFAGQLTRPLHLKSEGAVGVIGVRFHIAAAGAYVGAPLSRFTDRRASLDEIAGPGSAQALAGAVGNAGDEAARLALVQDHVAAGIARRNLRDPLVEVAVALLEDGVAVEALPGRTGLSPRTLQRRFAAAAGVPPRMLAAILRFRGIFDALGEASLDSWTEVAQAAGYFDHPQMARDFRRFVGCTPSQFVARNTGLAASLVDLG